MSCCYLFFNFKLTTTLLAHLLGFYTQTFPITIRFEFHMKRSSLKEILELYENQRWTLQQIAEHLGVTKQAIHSRLKRAGIETRPYGPRPVQIEKDDLHVLYVQKGLSIKEVAKRLNSTPGKIVYAMRRYKIQGRRPNEWLVKHPELGKLAVGESVDLPKTNRKKPHVNFYTMAKRHGFRISTKSIDDKTMRVTRRT
jgi:IS30 family transposase